MPELRVDTRAEGVPPQFDSPTADLVHFLSFAVAERYGATHELSGAARILRDRGRRDALRPLLTFAEDNPGDAEDLHDMEQIWQEAAPVAEAADWAAAEIRSSRVLQELTAGFPGLTMALDQLAEIARWSAARGARIRLLFRL